MTTRRRRASPESLRWLTQDYSVLRQAAEAGEVFDVLIVGSGYGGAMAAAELAGLQGADGRAIRVAVLERGREYAPGMFASSLQDLPPHVRIHRSAQDKTLGRLDALLDVRIGPDVCAILGNGLGGGSLVNAGVMEQPRLRDLGLPPALVADLDDDAFAQVRQALGASDTLHSDHAALAAAPLAKTAALQRAGKFHHAAITVQTKPGAGTPQCTLCGDCMTGCNVGAKRSLDTTLLAHAWRQGAELYTGGSVLSVRRHESAGHWLLETSFTDASLRHRHEPVAVAARKVVLAAGTLGSTEILLRSRSQGLAVSDRLGMGFSCNGDNLIAAHAGQAAVHSAARESVPLDQRRVGPTITGVVELEGVVLEEFSVPAPLKRFFDEAVTTSSLLHALARRPRRRRSQHGLDSMAVDPQAMENTMLVGLVGHDESDGRIVLPRHRRYGREQHQEGRVRIRWPEVRNSPLMAAAYARAEAALQRASPGAQILPSPLWRLVPEDMEFLVQGARGPVLTVHPLGGCAMGRTRHDGVVDHLGRVFQPSPAGDPANVYDGLLVLDGSVIPQSLGINPALTIAAISRRAARQLAAQWRWTAAPGRVLGDPGPRPTFRPAAECTPAAPLPTQVELMERLAGAAGDHWVEITVCCEHVVVADLAAKAVRHLEIAPERSTLRVYEGGAAARRTLLTLPEEERDRQAVFSAQLEGRLSILEPVADAASGARALRMAGAWLVNRGSRELWDWATGVLRQPLSLGSFLASAARAGEVRAFDYSLRVGQAIHVADAALAGRLPPGTPLAGSKRLTYGWRSNPWRQLTQVRLDGFPGMQEPVVLRLDGRFLARQGVPLMRITQQENQVVALAELASLGATWMRALASIHLWSFRAPDAAPRRAPRLLPGAIGRKVQPTTIALDLEDPGPGAPVRVLLTRYENRGKPPVALVHGYSASGNTFTHPAIPVPLARHLWDAGHDVWVLDLRTSAGLPTARRPWRFEDAAFADLPVAIAHIARETHRQVDVFAHCIGACMLSMSLLTDAHNLQRFTWPAGGGEGPPPKRWGTELEAMQQNVRRIVLSQKGPALVYCDDNVLRAYFMRVLRQVILPKDYQFRAAPRPGATHGLLDRLLATLPYPPEEFALENSWLPWRRAPWAGFRHRMDALYARDFTLGNVADGTLAAIEDLFGPLNLDTVAQAIHFARHNAVTDGSGRPFDMSGAVLRARWPKHGTLGLHGVDNGLVDIKTLDVMQAQMAYAGVPYRAHAIDGYGHQDCLIGRHAGVDVFPVISDFLQAP